MTFKGSVIVERRPMSFMSFILHAVIIRSRRIISVVDTISCHSDLATQFVNPVLEWTMGEVLVVVIGRAIRVASTCVRPPRRIRHLGLTVRENSVDLGRERLTGSFKQ